MKPRENNEHKTKTKRNAITKTEDKQTREQQGTQQRT